MMRDMLLAVGLLLSTASQLRIGGLAIGPGEVCLVTWLLLMLGREMGRLGPPLTPALSKLLVFWALFTIAQSLGLLTAFALRDEHDPAWFLHDVIAYPFAAALSCLSVVEPGAAARMRRVTWILVALGTPSLALQLAQAWGMVDAAPIDPWYWDRMRGWSANPEQLALLCAVLGLLSLHLADTAAGLGERIAAMACAILPIYVGRLSKTDTLNIVLVAAGPIFLVLKFRNWLLSSEPRMTFRSAVAGIAVFALPLVLVSAVPLGPTIAARTAALAKELSKDRGKTTQQEVDLRLQVWGQAISRGFESGMLGLGPGPHLAIPPSILAGRLNPAAEPKNVLHPAPNFAPNYEAHNTVLELLVQGGLLAVLSFLWLSAAALFGTYRARLAGLTTALCGLFIYGITLVIVRHPIFWFVLALCLVAAANARMPSTGSSLHPGRSAATS